MRHSLANVACHELNLLVQETKISIRALKRQRQSVMEAIELAQILDGQTSPLPDEVDGLLMELLARLGRLTTALDQAMHEAERIEMAPISPHQEGLIAWTISLELEAGIRPCVPRPSQAQPNP